MGSVNLQLFYPNNSPTNATVMNNNGTAINGGSVTIDGVTLGGTAVGAVDATNIQASLDAAIALRADYGAQMNRLESRSRFLASSVESMEAAKSRIMDADYAKETANATRLQILQQASAAMLAQAQQMPQIALSLLR